MTANFSTLCRSCLATVLFLVAATFATAQIAKPLPMGPATVDTSGGRLTNRYDGIRLGVELTGGLNIPLTRSTRFNDNKWDGLRSKPGLFLGANAVLTEDEKTAVLLGIEYVLERGALTGYSPAGLASGPITRRGDIEFREHQMRVSLQVQFTLGRLRARLGGHVSHFIENTYRFDYVQRTNILTDFSTGMETVLSDPIETRGSATRSFDTGSYLGLLIGVGYPVTERATARLRYDGGIHSILGSNRLDRHGRSRLDVGVDYRLFVR